MSDFIETAYNHIRGEKNGTFCTGEQKWVNKINKYKVKHPEDVTVKVVNTNGSIVAEVPQSWFKLSPPKRVSEENRQLARERFSKMKNKA